MVRNLKVWPEYFDDVRSGVKPFELRKNDRSFEVGDILILAEFNNEKQKLTGRITIKEITYILHEFQNVLKEGYVILGLKEGYL